MALLPTTAQELATYIEHTNLQAYATEKDIAALCGEARQHGFRGVCVNPGYAGLARRELDGSSALVITVCGFPLGATSTRAKVREALKSIEHGAKEVDMVLNVGYLKSGWHTMAGRDIAAVAAEVHKAGGILKLITENCYLTADEKQRAWQLGVDNGADYLKTSTGFGKPKDAAVPTGATLDDVRAMRALAPPHVRIKAAGGVSDAKGALEMIAAGADTLGTSKGVVIVQGMNP